MQLVRMAYPLSRNSDTTLFFYHVLQLYNSPWQYVLVTSTQLHLEAKQKQKLNAAVAIKSTDPQTLKLFEMEQFRQN